jgi:RHS repeat-associated protein
VKDYARKTNSSSPAERSVRGAAKKQFPINYQLSIQFNYQFNYQSINSITNQIDPDGVSVLFTYNPKGEQACTVLDWNQDHAIDFGGSDRITFTTNDVVSDYSTNVRRTRVYSWGQTGIGSSNLASTYEASTDGSRSWSTLWNNGVGVTSQRLVVYAGDGNRYETNIAPDGSYSVSAFEYGRLTSVGRYDAGGGQMGQTSYNYDAHGRQNAVTDARTGTTTYFFNSADQITGVVTPSPASGQAAQATTNYFDGMGRVFATILPDNTSVTNVFNSQGLVALTYGSRTYPVGYGYDAKGRMKFMTNWSDFTGNSGARVTSWNYDPYRGFLTGKSYDNGNNVGPSYFYTPGGRLQSRTWARGITTSYAYNPAGQLSAVIYSDGTTPGLSFGYDRQGRQTSVTNGPSICTLLLNDAGEVLVEAYTGAGPLSGFSTTNGYDTLLRRTRYTTLASGTPLTLVNETYDAASRPATFSDGVNSAGYAYIANSPLVGQISFSNYAALKMITTKSYDNLNRLTAIGTTNGQGSAIDVHLYAYNNANQRTAVTNADNSYWIDQYDNLGQVTSGTKYWSDGTPVAGQQFGYAFDSIGNRQGTAAGGDQNGSNLRTASYAANNLNQYTSRTVSGAADITGSATNTATVTVNGQSTYRRGEYYRAEVTIDNSAGPVFQSVSNLAVLSLDTNIVSANIVGSVFLPESPEAFTYDADGNLTGDGRWTYFWDAENRLIGITNNTNVPDAAKMSLNFTYDHLGRRVAKTVLKYDAFILSYQTVLQNTFVYDGWNLQAELNGTNNALLRSYVWGSDLSGTLQGAGGVSGLLWISQPQLGNAESFACFDGNGNVSALVYCPDASVVAQYEYGPFGEVIRATGPMAKANPFRFSTKYQDDETDLFYYGCRYYNASTGRWLARDVFGEWGGQNLYGFVGNNAIDGVDWLGFCTLGKKKAPAWDITIAPQGISPTAIKGMSEMSGAANSIEILEKLMLVAETGGAGASAGASEAVTVAADKLIEKGAKPDTVKMVERIIGLLPAAGEHYGYQPHTRVKYKECVCGGLGHFFANYWEDKETDWKLYDGRSDYGLGTFESRVNAIKAGATQAKKELQAWKDANKEDLE